MLLLHAPSPVCMTTAGSSRRCPSCRPCHQARRRLASISSGSNSSSMNISKNINSSSSSSRSRSRSSRHRYIAFRAAGGDDDDVPSTSYQNSLETTIKRKSKQVEAALQELGMEGLEERLSSATQNPASPAYKLSRLVSETTQMQGRAVIVVEVTRATPATTPQQLAAIAKTAIQCGADALCVRLDTEDTPQGLQDLFAVVQAAKRVPVLARDWIIHPLQLVDAKEAGAAGVLGVVGQVNGRGTAVMSSFGAAIGLDAPVEVVNAREMEGLARAGVTFFGINLSVGLSVAVPGFASDMAHGLLGELPFGAISIVGVKDVEQARKARLSGADALLVKKEMIDAAAAAGVDLRTLLDQVFCVTCGDD